MILEMLMERKASYDHMFIMPRLNIVLAEKSCDIEAKYTLLSTVGQVITACRA